MNAKKREDKYDTTRKIIALACDYFPNLAVREEPDRDWIKIHIYNKSRLFGLMREKDVIVFRYQQEGSDRIYLDVFGPDYLEVARGFAREFISRGIDPNIKDFSTTTYL